MCCQVLETKPPNFAFAESCALSEYFPSSFFLCRALDSTGCLVFNFSFLSLESIQGHSLDCTLNTRNLKFSATSDVRYYRCQILGKPSCAPWL